MFPRTTFKYYENYKIIRLIIITQGLGNASRLQLLVLYNLRKEHVKRLGQEDKIVLNFA